MSPIRLLILLVMFVPLMTVMLALGGHYTSFISVLDDQRINGSIWQNDTIRVVILFDEIPPDDIFYVVPVIDGINEWEEKLNAMYPDGEWNIDITLWIDTSDNLEGYDIYTNVVLGYDIACQEHYKGITSYDPFVFGKGYIKNETIITDPCNIDNYKSGGEVRAISSHEFGHSIGLGHSSVDNDLMCNYANCNFISEAPHVSQLNLMAVRLMYGADGFGLPNTIDFNKTRINNP